MGRFDKQCVSEQTVIKIAQDARLAYKWVFVKEKYSNKSGTWHTPGELNDHPSKFTNYSYEEFQVRDPRPIIHKGRRYIEMIKQKQSDFEKKIADFYAGKIK